MNKKRRILLLKGLVWVLGLAPLAIRNVAAPNSLSFEPLQDEQYDFAIPEARRARPAVQRFIELLQRSEVRAGLEARGFTFG